MTNDPRARARAVEQLTRAAAHDVRGRANTLALVIALLEDHTDPTVQKAVDRVRRANAELVSLATTLEATGDLYDAVKPPRTRVSALVGLFASRANVRIASNVADDAEVFVDAVALVDAVAALLGADPDGLTITSENAHVALRVPGARPRLGDSPSLAGLRLELAATRGDGELEVDAKGVTIRLRFG